MTLPAAGAAQLAPVPSAAPASRRGVTSVGVVLIGVIVVMALYDLVLGYRAAIDDTRKELALQARMVAEQTTRSLQAVDVVLRHVEAEYRRGRLARLGAADLHAYLNEQAVGLVQIDGLAMHDAQGAALAVSWLPPGAVADVSKLPTFRALSEGRRSDTVVGAALNSPSDGHYIFPIARRLVDERGQFAGAVGARGRIEYFRDFYRDIGPDTGTVIALMHRDGSVIARYPETKAADATAGREADRRADIDGSRPDGAEQLRAQQPVADYELEVVITRDPRAALATWRAQAWGTFARTAALAALAGWLLWLLSRQLARLAQVRDSLVASRERFALAVAGSDDGIWDWNRRTDEVFASARARELFGLPPGPETQSRESWFAAVPLHPDDAPAREAAVQDHLAGRTPLYEGEYRVRNADGSYRWVRIRGLCVRDAAGEAVRMAGSVSDIDARKRAEEALRQSEERYQIAMTGSNEAHWVWDLKSDEVFASPMICQVLGIPIGVSLRKRADFFERVPVHPDDRDRLREAVNDHLAGLTPRIDVEYRVVDMAGELRWIQTRGQCFRDEQGLPQRVAGATVEVTQRKRAEEALRRSEEALRHSEQRYQLAVAGANQGLWDWDMVTDTVFMSPRAQQLFGLVPGEPLRSRAEWIALWQHDPQGRLKVREVLKAYLEGRSKSYEVEYAMRMPSGEWRWFYDRGVAVRDDDGRPVRMAGSVEDITERKNAQAERERLEGQLRQAQKLEAMGTLAGGVAHDFNNILAAILGYGEMVQREAPDGTPMRRHIDAAMSAGMRAKALVERILAFSRSGMGERVPVHVRSVVAGVLDDMAGSLPAGITLERRLDAGNAAVVGDPTQLQQVVLNLCTNAVHAVGTRGRVTVAVDTEQLAAPRTTTTATLPAGSYVRLCVSDTGTGISPQVMERLFDPFFTTKEVGAGTGLGLSLVHGIVSDLGGGIDVESSVGQGARFTVLLPWAACVSQPRAVEAPVEPGRGETVLLVDDETALVALGEEMLAELGYEPVGFSSSLAALEAFRADPTRFDAVMSDEAMPGLTGSELAVEIRRLRPDIPIVLMSGYATPALGQRAREAGVREVLAKPLVARDIAQALAQALGPARTTATARA